MWAQAGTGIPVYGTTHADYFYGEVPCTREMTDDEIKGNYEENTRKVIIETFLALKPEHMSGVFVKSHAPFTWEVALQRQYIIQYCLSRLPGQPSTVSCLINEIVPIKQELLDRHFLRKHGAGAYYGQKVTV